MDQDLARLNSAFSQATEQAVINRGTPGRLGKTNGDGTFTFDVVGRPGWVYVQYNDGDRNTVVEALNGGVSYIPDLPVILLKMADGQFKVEANGTQAAEHVGAVAGVTGVGSVPPHTHEYGGGNTDFVSPRRLLYGTVRATRPASMSVQIEPFSYGYGGADFDVPLSTFDLTPYQPGTSGAQAWVKVGYDPAAGEFVAVMGDEHSVMTPLDASMLADISMTGYIPLGAVIVREDDTTLPEIDANKIARYADIRQFLSAGNVLGPASTDDLPEGVANLYFSTERAQDAVGAALVDSASIDATYNDGANTISFAVIPAGVDHNSLANLTTGDPHTQYTVVAPATSARNVIQPSAANAIPLTIRPHASQSVDIFAIQNSGGTATIWQHDSTNRIIFNRPSGGTFTAATIPAQQSALTVANTGTSNTIHRAIWSAVQTLGSGTISRSDGVNSFVYPGGSGTLGLAIGGLYAVRPTSSGPITLAEGVEISIAFQTGATSTMTRGDLIAAFASTVSGSAITTLNHMYVYAPSGAGTITNLRGIYLENMSAGTTTNFAIVTNAGNIVFNEGGDATTDFRVEGDTDINLLFTDASADAIGIGTSGPTTKFHTLLTDAGTNAIVNVLTMGHDTSGTAAAGFGAGLIVELESSTTAAQSAGRLTYEWATATHASRKALSKWTVFDTAEREAIRIEASGTAAMIGFFGVAAVVKPTALTAQETTVTYTAPGTPDYAIQDLTQTTPWGFASHDEGNTVLQVIANLQTRLAEVETKLQALGLLS